MWPKGMEAGRSSQDHNAHISKVSLQSTKAGKDQIAASWFFGPVGYSFRIFSNRSGFQERALPNDALKSV